MLPSQSVLSLELLDSSTVLLTNLSIKLTPEQEKSLQLVPSLRHKGYSTGIHFLNALKRLMQDLGVKLPQLPQSAFKMFKTVYSNSINDIRNSKNGVNRIFPQSKFEKNLPCTQFMNLGKWILSAHQLKSVDFFMKNGRRILLKEGWNMGKTVTSLACLQQAKCSKILIVTKKSLFNNWIWHIQQLAFSFNPGNNKKVRIVRGSSFDKIKRQPVVGIKKQCGNLPTILIEVIDQISSDGNGDFVKSEESTKQEQRFQMRTQILKIKKDDTDLLKDTQFTICCEDKLSEQIEFKRFNGLIVDTVSIFQKNSLIQKINNINNIVICANISIQQSKMTVPLLNPKMTQNQTQLRYGRLKESLKNKHEYQSCLLKYYCVSGVQNIARNPGFIVKSIICTTSQNNKADDIALNQNEKAKAAVNYLKQVIQDNRVRILQNKIHYFAVHNNNITQNILTKTFKNDSFKQEIQFGSIKEAQTFLKKLQKSNVATEKKIVILCSTFLKSEEQQIKPKLYEIYKTANIEYIELAQFDKQTGKLIRIQKNNPNVYYPYIDFQKSFDNILTEQVCISSDDDQKSKKRVVNPQRYIQTQSQSQRSQDHKMVDESFQVLDSKIPYTINLDESDDSVNLQILPSLKDSQKQLEIKEVSQKQEQQKQQISEVGNPEQQNAVMPIFQFENDRTMHDEDDQQINQYAQQIQKKVQTRSSKRLSKKIGKNRLKRKKYREMIHQSQQQSFQSSQQIEQQRIPIIKKPPVISFQEGATQKLTISLISTNQFIKQLQNHQKNIQSQKNQVQYQIEKNVFKNIPKNAQQINRERALRTSKRIQIKPQQILFVQLLPSKTQLKK